MLYKYRSIKDFKFFVDIILKQRLFAAFYFDMNDPMEGQYLYNKGVLSKSLVKAIKGEKERIRICSLSRIPEHPLMWAHYADGHRGVVIGVDVDRTQCDIHPIMYRGVHQILDNLEYATPEIAKEILCHKSNIWSYEEEERIFITEGMYVKVEVKKIILGTKMNKDDKQMMKQLINKLSPEIEVINSKSNKIY
jgi:hypothetical protein